MRNVPVVALALLAVLAPGAAAVELKSPRACNGLFGATRANAKYLPGDVLILAFEIEDLKTDPKTGVANYQQAMEITDAGGTSIFAQKPAVVEVPLFGGKRLSTFVQAIMTLDQKPGKYKVKVTVTDTGAKETKELTYDFELLKMAFGIVQPLTPAVGFIGQDFAVHFAFVGFDRDPKKMPDIEVATRLLDETGKPVIQTPISINVKD